MTPPLALALALTAASGPSPSSGPPSTLAVAVAANLEPVVPALVAAFEATRPDVHVAVTTGASGLFFAQVSQGAPFDLFLSADRDYPRRLIRDGLTAGPEVVYAIGRLVVWTPRGSSLAPAVGAKGLPVLAGPGLQHLAIANPAVAPFGRAAESALRAAGVLETVRDRLVLGQSVAQAAQFASTGAADAALLPLSLTLGPGLAGGSVAEVPTTTYPRLEQSAVVLAGGAHPSLAEAFLAFVTGPKGRAILARGGFGLP